MAIKYKELYIYILGVLKTLKDAGKGKLVSLNDVVSILRPETEMSEVIQLAKYLEADGDIEADYKLGQVFVTILPKGIIDWENNTDDYSEILNGFLSGRRVQDIVKDFSEKPVIDFRREPIKLVEELYAKIENSPFLNPDLLLDLQIILLELKKNDADTELIKQKIDHIGQSINAIMEISEFKNQLALTD